MFKSYVLWMTFTLIEDRTPTAPDYPITTKIVLYLTVDLLRRYTEGKKMIDGESS